MLRYISGTSLFDSNADALVNPVNCAGTMGKGIAKEFAIRFPEILPPYKEACLRGVLRPGMVMKISISVKPDYLAIKRPAIILYATKDHWRNKSRLDWIRDGAVELSKRASEWGLKSVAMPQVGCGLGGLNWDDVRPLLEQVLAPNELDIIVYGQHGDG